MRCGVFALVRRQSAQARGGPSLRWVRSSIPSINLRRADVSPKTVQTLARHGDIRLTMNLYSHVDLADQSAAIARPPGVGGNAGMRGAG